MLALLLLLLVPALASARPTPPSTPLRQKPNNALVVDNRLGQAQGVADGAAVRFVVTYATASRWQSSAVATQWLLPNGLTDPSAMPNACPQPTNSESTSPTSEDCLSLILYVPASLMTSNSHIPTLMWIHGGSFQVGSATDPGIDGANLAVATSSIVAVIQYRLGVLGFLTPGGGANLAVEDAVNALKFLQVIVPSFGGDASKITIAGQSSGASMVRTLLAVPSAADLFQSAILQSDPMDYTLLTPDMQQTFVDFFNSDSSCTAFDTSCLASLSLDDIINDLQSDLIDAAPSLVPAAGAFEPLRAVLDGSLITSSLDSSKPFPAVSKHIMVTNVNNEAGPAIYGANNRPIPESNWVPAVNASFGTERTNVIVASPYYKPVGKIPDARVQLQELGTDSLWRCASWTFAESWVANGGTAYVGVYALGATYHTNTGIPFCLEKGNVCHEDDITIVFGTTKNPSSAQASLTKEMQARYKAFLYGGNPNAAGFRTWTPASASTTNAISLGGTGLAPVGACIPTFWGVNPQYDYQVFGV